MNRIKIAVDVDGVLIDLMSEFIRIYNDQYPENKKYKNDITSWNFFDDWLTEDEMYDIFHSIKMENIYIIDKNAHEYLLKLNKAFQVDIVTARREETRHILIEKLESMNIFKGKQYNQLIIVPYKPYDSKIKLDYQIYIDDNPNLLEAMKSYQRTKFLYLWDQPWNHENDLSPNIKRISNWDMIMQNVSKNTKFNKSYAC